MRPNTYDDTKAYCLCKVFVPPDEINCFSQNVQLQSACSNKFVRVGKDRSVIANENSEYPQNFTIMSDTFPVGENQQGVRIWFYIKELESYICFNKKWQPRIFKKLMKTCYFKEEMDGGYFLFSSMMNPTMYLGFNRRGKPINSTSPNTDKQCRKIFKRITEESSNGLSASTIDYEQTTSASSSSNYVTHRVRHHHGLSSSQATKTHPRTHSNRIATSESIATLPQTSSKRNKLQSNHHHRHRHNEQPLHHHHTTSNNIDKDIDNLSSTKQLGYEDLNAIYNQSDSGVNILSEIKPTAHFRHTKRRPKKVEVAEVDSNPDDQPQLGVHRRKDPNSTADSVNLGRDENSNTDNCTYGTDENDDKQRGRRIGKSRGADDKPNNKCNNRKHKKHNENGRLRKPSQKASSHKNQTSEPLNLN